MEEYPHFQANMPETDKTGLDKIVQIIGTIEGTSLGMSMSRYTRKDRQPGTHILTHTKCMMKSHTHGGESIFKERDSKRRITGVLML